MCGICGIVDLNNHGVQEAQIRQMMQIMKHRGPDDEGVFIENNVGLGFVRLSIIDLTSAGHQPKLSQDERYVIVFNGEIYNYIELREELQKEGVIFATKTDTEVLLNAYIQWGEDCLDRFNGMWAFAIYDREEKKIFSARDRYGIKPFYYLKTDEYFAFCSEIPPLLSLLDQNPKPNYQTIFDFLVFNRTDQTESTFFEEIKKLQHGHCLYLNCNFENKPKISPNTQFPQSAIRNPQSAIPNPQFEISQWYDLRKKVADTQGFKSSVEFKELFSSAVSLRLRSDVPVGVCLSGGLDSSSIVSVLLKDFDKKDLNTFSAVYNNGQYGDETEFINEYKPLLQNMYYIIPDASTLENDLFKFVKAHGEPIPATGPYAQFKVMELAQGKVVVTLDGQGADEELAGYHYFFGFYFKDLLTHGRIGKLCIEMYHYLAQHRSLMGIKSFLYFMLPERIRTKARVNEKGYLIPDFVDKFKNSNSIAGNLYGSKSLTDALLDHFEYKLEHLLKWEDRNSMWFSLESRVPFLDFRLVEKTLATSSDLKIKKGMTKYILREAMRGILPEKIRLRHDKIGFGTPQNEWFREPVWQNIVNGVLDSESFKDRNLINPKIAKELYQKHLSGEGNVSKEIWKWVHLELWFREFID
jgi:asparagine synthase (glutamine-hydrolysing)